MLKKLIYSIAAHHHPWRKLSFDELAELYTSMTMRSLGFSLIGIFVPVYLYTTGISLQAIYLFFAFFFLLRIPVSFAAGLVVGRIGPKHSIALSTMLFIVFLGLLTSYEVMGWPLWLLSTAYTLANGLFFIAYNTDFSKINHSVHGGKELGWLMIFERAGGALGPVVGGLLAGLFAPQASMIFAIIVLAISLVPLFLTNEPVKTHQKIDYLPFNNRKYARDFVAFSSYSIVNVANGLLWPLLVAVFIFTDGTYEKLGALVGLGLAVSIISARMFGVFIDKKRGKSLLRFGVYFNVIVSVCRSAIDTAGGALAGTLLAEPVALAYRMPVSKGYYDTADSIKGKRIVYLVWGESWGALAKSIFLFAMAAACIWMNEVTVLRASFIVVGVVGLAMLAQRFPALKQV